MVARASDDLEIQVGAGVNITDDVQGALDAMKPGTALYIGGMGHRTKNFHNDNMVRRGYADAAGRIQELFLAGRKEEGRRRRPRRVPRRNRPHWPR